MQKIKNHKDPFFKKDITKNSNLSKSVKFKLPFSIEECFNQIIKISFQTLNGVNYHKLDKYRVGDIFKSKDGKKYELTSFNPPNIYQLTTRIENKVYKTTYYLQYLKPKKTQIEFSEVIMFEKNLKGFRETIGLINFNKEFDKRSKQITLHIYKGLVRGAKISKN
ncbi:DUF3284 domain-containing protein [Spiroplasma endosymbiont of Aspidapion aeneum]|uniref:DUF3284 domain-containing protein n=1 Tax=Spiroplasma endosymbiont of Aspidapion aeneum TaxID=3066276 RepID=UPI00313E9182